MKNVTFIYGVLLKDYSFGEEGVDTEVPKTKGTLVKMLPGRFNKFGQLLYDDQECHNEYQIDEHVIEATKETHPECFL